MGHNCNGSEKGRVFCLGKMAQGTFYHPRFPFWLWVQNIDPQKRKEKLLGFCSDPAGHWGSLGFQCSFQHDHPTYYFDPIDINSLDPAMSTSCSEPPFVETVRGSLGHCRRLNGLERDVGPSPSCIDLTWKETCRRRNMESFKILVTWWFYEISRDYTS